MNSRNIIRSKSFYFGVNVKANEKDRFFSIKLLSKIISM